MAESRSISADSRSKAGIKGMPACLKMSSSVPEKEVLGYFFRNAPVNSGLPVERNTSFADQPRAVQKVIDHHRLKYIQFEVACCTADAQSHIVSHNLC